MDPNETLRQIRLLLKQMEVDEDMSVHMDHAAELCEHVSALDNWMSSGGFRPQAWMRNPTDS